MPPTLDLSRTKHSKMIVSPPRINLRRAASYTKDGGPLSSTSSRFNFNHLVFSPPPSPGLPAPAPRPRKPPPGLPRPSRTIRLACWIAGAVLIIYMATSALRRSHLAIPAVAWMSQPHDKYKVVGQDILPDFPTPIAVESPRGKAGWTVSIPPSHDFPLSPAQYSDICAKCGEVSARISALRSHDHTLPQPYIGFGSASSDRYFIDVHEAEETGVLPGPSSKGRSAGKQGYQGSLVGVHQGSLVQKPVCERSLTFVLESEVAGLGRTLMALWVAYAEAKRQGRAFFIDDTRWAYGPYGLIFQPPPMPACSAPPRHQMVPCPRQARHLVATTATLHVLLGEEKEKELETAGFNVAGEAARGHEAVARDRTMFRLARQGYDALFRLTKEDAEYVDNRVRDLTARRVVPKSRGKQNGLAVGLHVRRGDRHPLEYQYRASYIPAATYMQTARDLLDERYNTSGPHHGEDRAAKEHSLVVLASDDPLVYDSDEFAGTSRAQDRIQLASKAAIQQAQPNKHVMRKYVDETFGWEGGFFAAMFWNLGGSGANAATAAAQAHKALSAMSGPSPETLRLRSLIGRAYMMDLAVLADLSDAIVCTVSSMGCRLLAVMMGWESAMENGNWINIDGNYPWTAL